MEPAEHAQCHACAVPNSSATPSPQLPPVALAHVRYDHEGPRRLNFDCPQVLAHAREMSTSTEFSFAQTKRKRPQEPHKMTHAWHDVTPGENLPAEFTTIIEIPTGSSVKYELDKETGLLRLDRRHI